MSAAAITSALLPQGQGGAELPAATQGALAVLDSVFGAILKGVGSEDEGSQVATRDFGASETNGDSSLPQPQGSAVTASASSPTATFEASLAALDYEAMAGTDGSSGIATQAKPSQSQTLTQAQRRSPRRWTPTASPSQTDSRKAWTSRTVTSRQYALDIKDKCAFDTDRRRRIQAGRARFDVGARRRSDRDRPDCCKRCERRESSGTAAANAATAPVHGGAVHGSVKAPSSETRKGASEIAATGQDVFDAAPAVGAPLNASQTASISAQFSASAMTSPSPSQGSGSDAANNQTKAPVLELGQKFWAWPKSDASDADVAASHWDISGATPLNSLLAADSSLGFQGLEAKRISRSRDRFPSRS